MASESLPESTLVILSHPEWAAVIDAVTNLHSVLNACDALDAERKVDLLSAVYKQLSAAIAPINERLSDEEAGEDVH